MDKQPETALRASIKKWEDIVAGIEVDKGASNCALCKLYISDGCAGCPVAIATGKKYCHGTPYYVWHEAAGPWYYVTPKSRPHAEAMLAFLRSLLPGEDNASDTMSE